ncbi:S8 family serine peptidase [Streptobacillus moniliformis]|uniref:S8 family serine peptidase n=1 Tax=Streptobacillus moniliformis TaxID=34105 RepID=UPI0007E3787E|nr:S8 family serine peptidase [Streptobacillus moniliformis]
MKFKRFQFLGLLFLISCSIVDIDESIPNVENIGRNISSNYIINSENNESNSPKINSNVEKKEIMKDSESQNTINTVDNNEKLKQKLDRNESLIESNINTTRQLKEEDNPVTIVELFLNKSGEEKIKEKYGLTNFIGSDNSNTSYNEHALRVLDGFMDTNADGIISEEEKNIFKGKNPGIKLVRRNHVGFDIMNTYGILSMSYSSVYHNINFNYLYPYSKYLDKIYNDKTYLNDYLTKRLLNKNYVYNERLLISAIGNQNLSNLETKYFSNDLSNKYQVMSPEMQALSRSESLLVKNSFRRDHNLIKEFNKYMSTIYIDSDSNYYSGSFTREDYHTQALLLRSFTVGESGLLDIEDKRYYPDSGSSYSTPRIARLAYDIKEKYPFLTYQQVKQVILGTANHDISGYLDDNVGWGNANREKALKGPSDFNAGLIDEMKYFKGNYDKIFDENGNRYFYVNIKKDKEYTFENDIVSGLKGDGNNKESKIIKIIAKKYSYDNTSREYQYRIPKVLESEKLFYSNIAQAGLRKDGEGKLILTGKQEYTAPSQVLNGTLVLKNDSKSDYTIAEKGTLVVENRTNDESEIKLKNIYTDGKLKIDSTKTSIDKLHGTHTSDVEFSGKEINIKEFRTTGEYTIRVKENEQLNLNIEKFEEEYSDFLNNLSNPFLKPVVINKDKIVSIKFVDNINEEFKKLGEITDEKILKDLPSYDVNKKKFFDEYIDNTNVSISGTNVLMKPMSSSLRTLLLSSNSSEVKNIFTDNYASIVGNIIKNEIDNKYNRTNIILNNLEKGNRLYFDTYVRTNILNDEKFSPFVDKNYGAIIGYSRKLLNGNVLNLYGIYQYGNVEFKNSGSNKTKSINNLYNVGINISKKIFDIFAFDFDKNIGYSKSDVYNDTSDINKKTNILQSLSINPSIKLSMELKINSIKSILKPYVGYSFNYILIWGKKDNEAKENESFINRLRNIGITSAYNNNLEAGVEIDSKINDRISIQNRLVVDYNSLDEIKLNQKLAEKLHKTVGKGLNKISANYNLGVKLKVMDSLNVIGKANINSKLNVGLNLGIDFNF